MPTSITSPLAALTTVFIPPCPISWLLTTTKTPSQFPPFPTTGPASCDPPFWTSNIHDQGFQYYSPAICPSGFMVGSGCQITKTRTAEGFPVVGGGETAVYCVPSGHSCTTDTTDFRGGVWGATSNQGIVTVGPALQIRFREADLPFLETHPLTPGLLLAGATQVETTVAAVPQSAISAGGFSTISPTTTFKETSLTADMTSEVVVTLVTTQSVHGGNTETVTASLTTTRIRESSSKSGLTLPVSTQTRGIDSINNNGPLSPSANSTSLAAMVLSSSIVVIAAAVVGFLFLQRRRRRRQLLSVSLRVWTGRKGSDEDIPRIAPYHLRPQMMQSRPRTANAELDDGAEFPELPSRRPLGTKENPAELDDAEIELSRSWSWMSRVSRLLNRAAQSSNMTRSSSHSMMTRQSETSTVKTRSSGDWEAFTKEKWPDGLTVPASAYNVNRPHSMAGTELSSGKSPKEFGLNKELLRVSVFTRLSEGTFGRLNISRGSSA